MNRDIWLVIGGIAAGVIGTSLLAKNREKIKPMAAGALASGMRLKDKATSYASKAKKKADEIVEEAKQINEAGQ